jgi:hypothetical protein
MAQEPSPSPTPKKPFPVWVVVLVVAAAAVAAIALAVSRGTGRDTTTMSGGNLNGPTNANAVANSNSTSNANAAGNGNEDLNANASPVPQGWTTYDSTTSSYSTIRRLAPSFKVSFPQTWKTTEDLGGLTLTEGAAADDSPKVQIARTGEVFGADIVAQCKARASSYTGIAGLVFVIARIQSVAGVDSAYLSYRLPDSVTTNENGRGNSLFVCVPFANGTDVLLGQPRASEMVSANFDVVLSTYSLNPQPTDSSAIPDGWTTYTSAGFGFSVAHPPEFSVNETRLSEAVARDRKDGHLADIGFYAAGLQGPLFNVRIYSKSLAEVVKNSDQVGTLTGEAKTVGSNTLQTLSGSVRRYGTEGPQYTYVVEVQNYRDDADLETFDSMLSTFHLD